MPLDTMTYQFFHVARDAELEEHAGRPVYYIFNNKSNTAIGRILWCWAWRQWVATFAEDAQFSRGCLADVENAIGKITAAE